MANEIPTFTPPTPTFTPPTSSSHGGAVCHFHPNEHAVTRCARCGKYICQDCAENYNVDGGEYKGQPLCYDCCNELVSDNVRTLKKQQAKIIANYIFTFIGMLFGLFIGLGISSSTPLPWYVVLIFAFVGGTLWTFIKNGFRIILNGIKNLFKNGFNIIGLFLIFFVLAWDFLKAIAISVWGTIQKLFNYTKYIIQTAGFIRSDTAALQQMADYMEYTQIRSQNVGVDLATLMNEDSELYNNTYARNVAQMGEQGVADAFRTATASYNEHGEIIRNAQATMFNESGEIIR